MFLPPILFPADVGGFDNRDSENRRYMRNQWEKTVSRGIRFHCIA